MNTEHGHITSAFDRDLESIQALIMKMAGLVEEQLADAARSLEERDEELAESVRGKDKLIDQLEEQINIEAARVIAMRAPAALDLRIVLSVLKISGSLERMGDFAKNSAKRTGVLVQLPAIGNASGALRRMTRTVDLMLKDSLDAYIQHDVDLAFAVRERDQDVDQMYNALFREFITHMMEDPRNITPCMHLHFIAKNIERMGDHVTGIAEQVIYLVTGEVPDEDRTKMDSTSFVAE